MMKFKKAVLLSAVAFSVLGCGKSMTGSYSLSETLISQTNTINSACTTSQLSMTLIQSGKNIAGTAVGGCFSEALTGSDIGNGQYNVNLTLVPSAQYGYSGQNCVYSGTLSIQNNQITGTLVLQQNQPQPQPSNQPVASGYSYCSTTVTMTGSLQQ